ncbi:MAG: hypothetical protein A4E19_02130 [Nitrospira sp. SG-bin1]|nr:MAG: hypothetical protein A4E19_02130 [Nitrospira sp. SG-bin1]
MTAVRAAAGKVQEVLRHDEGKTGQGSVFHGLAAENVRSPESLTDKTGKIRLYSGHVGSP